MILPNGASISHPKFKKRVSEPGKKGRTLEVTLPKTNMTIDKQPFEDVSAMKICDFSLPCEFLGRVKVLVIKFKHLTQNFEKLIWPSSGRTHILRCNFHPSQVKRQANWLEKVLCLSRIQKIKGRNGPFEIFEGRLFSRRDKSNETMHLSCAVPT